jgi:hypothetical protein
MAMSSRLPPRHEMPALEAGIFRLGSFVKAKDASTKKFQLALRVASPDGQTAYYGRSYAWEAGAPWKWVAAKKEALPIDLQFAYYPYVNKMRIVIDWSTKASFFPSGDQ